MGIPKSLIIVLLGALLVAACASPQQREIPPKTSPLKWNREDVIGLNLSLDDPVLIENLSFKKEGMIQADFGRKNGPVCGPILYWRISRGKLFIQGKEVVLISRTPATMTFKEGDGKLKQFKIEKNSEF